MLQGTGERATPFQATGKDEGKMNRENCLPS